MSEKEDVGKPPANPEPPVNRGKSKLEENAPLEKVKDKFSEIIDGDTGEGKFSAVVYDENGDEKDRLETRRISGPGSVEVRPFEDKNGNTKWAARRKDKLGHNKKDKLQGGD